MEFKRIAAALGLGMALGMALAGCIPNFGSQNAAPTAAATRPAENASTLDATVAAVQTEQAGPTPAAGIRLNLNTAGEAELRSLPGVDEQALQAVIQNRPFAGIEQFRAAAGEQAAALEQVVFVPIAMNEADIPTLLQIPGLDAAEAEALIAGRPYSSKDAFLTALSQFVSQPEMGLAETYLTP